MLTTSSLCKSSTTLLTIIDTVYSVTVTEFQAQSRAQYPGASLTKWPNVGIDACGRGATA